MLASEFLRKYNITGDVKFVTDFYEEGRGGRIPRRQYAATFVHKGRTLDIPEYTAGAQGSEAELVDVLYLVGIDAQAGAMDLDEFLGEFGTEDIERQRETWRACRDLSRRAYDWVTSEAMWDDLRQVEEG